ncbi:hypothetical protein H1D32_02670 [Anaerobacillus sp. CMMVII]|uniref:hypothetical protein n=1 Tax=Anaerobacillus sp. CMMVII TaxID=2755588 RepID=UPI0021B786EE|nr:hypothetical protein [Anaerobacillus sp. CMMVII]MCT8136752.1 hypothetical protein [Anaerobacillus sp. CMMVII]
MKKVILVAFLASLAVIITIWYTLPKHHDETFEGILYQLGSENRGLEEAVTIEVNGKIRNTLLGKKIFTGTLKLNGEVIPHPNAEGNLEIEFQSYGNGMISYWVNTDATIEGNYYFGDLL